MTLEKIELIYTFLTDLAQELVKQGPLQGGGMWLQRSFGAGANRGRGRLTADGTVGVPGIVAQRTTLNKAQFVLLRVHTRGAHTVRAFTAHTHEAYTQTQPSPSRSSGAPTSGPLPIMLQLSICLSVGVPSGEISDPYGPLLLAIFLSSVTL